MPNSTLATPNGYRSLYARLIALVVVCFAVACRAAPAPPTTVSADTWAVVDGRAVTRDEVEKAYRRARGASQALSEEEALTAKLALLNDFIVQEILVAKAGQLKIAVTDAELDAADAEARKGHHAGSLSAGTHPAEPDGGGHA